MFQSTVRLQQTTGIVGEVFAESPTRAFPCILKSTDAADNVIGRAFSHIASDDLGVEAGGSDFAGILVNPLVYANKGVGSESLAPTLVLGDETVAQLLEMGMVYVSLLNAGNIGDLVMFAEADGQLSALAEQAAFTASQATTVLTVSAITAGNIGVGSVIKNAAGEILGTVISLGTGTGGAGTYNLDTSATVASAAMSANSIAPAGQVVIPNAKVVRQNTSSAGLCIIQLTN